MASRELRNRVKAMVKKAYNEDIKVTELNELIKEYWEEMELSKQGIKVYNQYREATEEENNFKEKVYNFFSEEISLEEATSKKFREQENKICESAYKYYILIFSEIMCAAKMLLADGEKITNYNIRDILWSSKRYTNYSHLLSEIGYSVKKMWEIAFYKWNNNTWEYYNVGQRYSPTSVVIRGYFQLLAKNGIQ